MSAHLDLQGFDAFEGAARREAVDHLRGCAACRGAALAHDPTILFALLDEAPVPQRVLEEVSTGVARALDAQPAARRARRFAAAAMLALALICGWAASERGPALQAPAVSIADIPHNLPRAAVDVQPAQAVSGVVDFSVGETQVVMVYNGDLHL